VRLLDLSGKMLTGMTMTSDAAWVNDGMIVQKGVQMRARDGVIFVQDIYRPGKADHARNGRFPVIVERTPYDRSSERFKQFGRDAVARGYIFVVQDVRGRSESGGIFEMMTNRHDEGADGADTLAWVYSQNWCNGNIATVGGSYSATNQQAAALHQPKGLKAQVLRDCGTNYYQRSFRLHGAFNVGTTLAWIAQSASLGAEAQADPAVKAKFDDMRENIHTWVDNLPIKEGETIIALSPEYENYYFRMEQTSDDAPYWQSTGLRIAGHWDEYPKDVAPLLITGWFANHAAANFEKFNELGTRLERPVHMIAGPWIHSPGMLVDMTAGSVCFGDAAAQFSPVNETWLRWIDHFVRGVDNGVEREPRLHYFVMGSGDGRWMPDGRIFHGGYWRSSDHWPLPETEFRPYFLHAGGNLTTDKPSLGQSHSRYDFDPADPCPGLGSVTAQIPDFDRFVMTGPREQRCTPEFAACRGSNLPIAQRADVLVFETAPLVDDIEITGPIQARLWVSSSARDTDFTGKLIDVYPPSEEHPEGYALYITEGILRMRYRDDRPVGDLIEPGKVYAIALELSPSSNLFKRGHKLRLDISSSSFPQFDVNPNTGEPLGLHTHIEIAQQTIYHDADCPSHLLLPVQPFR
jgi:putative CocE/NonD family hydrolase